MAGEVKSSSSSDSSSDIDLSNFRWGFSVPLGAGLATRSDGNKTSVGPQFEIGIGPYVHWGKNSLLPEFFTNILYLDSPLFGQPNPLWVKTIGAKVNYGRDILPSLSFRGQLGLGLAIYGDFSKFGGQDGVYQRETFVGPHFQLGAGLCFLKDMICPMVSYSFDLNAYTRERFDNRPGFETADYTSSNAHGFNFLLNVDLGRL